MICEIYYEFDQLKGYFSIKIMLKIIKFSYYTFYLYLKNNLKKKYLPIKKNHYKLILFGWSEPIYNLNLLLFC